VALRKVNSAATLADRAINDGVLPRIVLEESSDPVTTAAEERKSFTCGFANRMNDAVIY
jgi:hypothetical protein